MGEGREERELVKDARTTAITTITITSTITTTITITYLPITITISISISISITITLFFFVFSAPSAQFNVQRRPVHEQLPTVQQGPVLVQPRPLSAHHHHHHALLLNRFKKTAATAG